MTGVLAVTSGGLLRAGVAPVRLELLDPVTLEPLDAFDGFPNGYPSHDHGSPLTDWGDDMTAVAGPDDTVAIAANCGDDPHVLAVAEVRAGRLSVHIATADGVAFAAQVPGERIHSVALGADALYVLDSDSIVTAFAWRAPDRRPRRVAALDADELVMRDGRLVALLSDGGEVLLD